MIVVALCYKSAIGPKIGFYEAKSEEAAGRYVIAQQSRPDYITHSFLPLKQ